MATHTLYFAGTDCWMDEGQVTRLVGGSNMAIYGGIAGYIPVRLHSQQQATRDQLKTVIPGPGGPWYASWQSLWVPCTIATKGGAGRDTGTGESMWDLAGHGAAKVAGCASFGRGKKRIETDADRDAMVLQARRRLGLEMNPANTAKPNSHDCYHFAPGRVAEAIELAELRGPRGQVTTINLIGHSRGGVAAIMCSHELAYMFPNAEVNVFAIDPVPGSGSLSHEMCRLGSTVKNYVGVYAADETSAFFNGVIPWPTIRGTAIDPLERTKDNARISLPNYHLVWAPGRHGTVAGNATNDGAAHLPIDADVAHIGTLIHRLASACLRAWGTDVPLTQLAPGQGVAFLKARLQHGTAVAKYRNLRTHTYTGDFHSPQHWVERGISSSIGSSSSAWEYLEDSIGHAPLVTRTSSIPTRLRRNRPDPGKVRWEALHDVPDVVYDVGRGSGWA